MKILRRFENVGDITDELVLKSIVDKTLETFGRIDILINNAGIFKSGGFEWAPVAIFDEIMDTNVRSMVVLTQLCISHLKKTKGSIVNVSSVNGFRPFVNDGYYCMSKAAVDMFTKCLALELAPDGVRVNAVNPGVILTNIHTRGGMDDSQYREFLDRSKQTHPLGRVGETEEVANVIAFLVSRRASFITGSLTPIDGGRNCVCPR